MTGGLLSCAAVFASALFIAIQPASAQRAPFANVKADAVCTLDGSALLVDAGLMQKDAPSSMPLVSRVLFTLEQHFPRNSRWLLVEDSVFETGDINPVDTLLSADERYDIATHDYGNICGLEVHPTANAVRAVARITVENANGRRPSGRIFTARCRSFPNPCR